MKTLVEQKAKELVDKFMDIKEFSGRDLMYLSEAKKCALICVEQLLLFAYTVEWEKKEDALSKIKFLKEVKQEINKL